jgi:hypothetical protein
MERDHFEELIELCHGEMWHLTNAPSNVLTAQGLVPPTDEAIDERYPGWQAALRPRKGAVYLTSPHGKGSTTGDRKVVVDLLTLDPELFVPDEDYIVRWLTDRRRSTDVPFEIDEDALPEIPKWVADVIPQTPPSDDSRGRWVARQGWDTSENTLISARWGSIAYLGTVPASSILEVIEVRTSRRWWDPEAARVRWEDRKPR